MDSEESLIEDNSVTYAPPPSVQGFLTSESFISLITGPVGSTKTSAGIMKIAYHAKQMAAGKDGIRRSRCVWVRNTNQMLLDTSIPDFLKWFPDGQAGVYEKTKMRFVLRFDDVVCEVLFRGLEDANDVRRLLSLQISFAILDEFREIHSDIYEALQGRLGRYPDKMLVPPRKEWGRDAKGNPIGGCVKDDGSPNKFLWGMTNPPDSDTYWEKLLTDPPANVKAFFQPSGLSPEADWTQFLPEDYYANLAEGKSQDWVDVYIHNKFGKSLSGQPVFRTFDTALHVAKTPLTVLSGPILVGVDAGLSPAAVLGQIDYRSRLVVHDALVSESMGALRFIREKLKPLLATKYPGRAVLIVIDPAAFQRAQTDERTVADMFKNEGFRVVPARSNIISARLASVEQYLTRLVDGAPSIIFDPEGCKPLLAALRGKYRYKVNTKGETDDKPEKNHPWSDVCFVAGTPVLTPSGYVPVETLRPGDEVSCADGADVVTCVGSQTAHKLVRLTLSDGSTLVCTPDHPFAVKNTHLDFVPADALTCKHHLASVEDGVWGSGLSLTRAKYRLCAAARSAAKSLKFLDGRSPKEKERSALQSAVSVNSALGMVLSTTGCGLPELAATTTTGTSTLTKLVSPSTSTSGKSTTDQYLTGTKSTTKTEIQPTTSSATSNCYGGLTTPGCTLPNGSKRGAWTARLRLLLPGKVQKLGTALKKVARGIASTARKSSLTVVQKDYLSEGGVVYNLTTERTSTYYAGPSLVHNCDGLQYLCMHANNGSAFSAPVAARREIKRVSVAGWT